MRSLFFRRCLWGIAMLFTCTVFASQGQTHAVAGEFPYRATFDDVTSPGNPVVTSLAVGPLLFAGDYFHTISDPSGGLLSFVDNGTIFIASEGGGLGMPITLSREDGQPFALLSIDVAEGFLDDAAAALLGFAPSTSIDLVAMTPGGEELAILFPLDGQKDGPGPLDDFETFTLPAEFGIVTSVTFSGSYGGGDDSAFALDNVIVGTAIPEPTSLLLLVIAAMGLMARRRRRYLFHTR